MTFKKTVPVLLLFLLVGTILILCAVPPVSRDALTHHLAVPKLYIEHGGIYELPDILPSYYPQLLDLLYCIPLIFKNDILPKYIHFFFAILTSVILFNCIKGRTGYFEAIWGVLFFLSLPVIIKLSTEVYVDLGLIYFSFGSLVFLLKWHTSDYKYPFFLLSALFCGLGLSTKYNGLITLFILTFFVPIIYLNKTPKSISAQMKAAGLGCLFFLLSTGIFSPWMIKNVQWTNNPVYPLYDQYFNSATLEKAERHRDWNHFYTRKFIYKEKWWQTISIPVRIFFQGKDNNPQYFDGILNPLLFFLPFLAIMIKPVTAQQNSMAFETKLLFCFSTCFILFVFLQTDMRIRWIGPAIPPLVVLSAIGINRLFLKLKKRWQSILAIAILILSFSPNMSYLLHISYEIDPFSYLTGKISKDAYIQSKRPEFKTIEYANINLGPKTKILSLFLGNRRYYFNHKVSFEMDLFQKIIKNSDHPKTMAAELKKENFSDIIVNYSLFNSWQKNNLNDSEIRRSLNFFKTQCTELFSFEGHGLYHLK